MIGRSRVAARGNLLSASAWSGSTLLAPGVAGDDCRGVARRGAGRGVVTGEGWRAFVAHGGAVTGRELVGSPAGRPGRPGGALPADHSRGDPPRSLWRPTWCPPGWWCGTPA